MILKNGLYNGIITSIDLKSFTRKDEKKTTFEVFKVSVRVNGEGQGLKDITTTFSKEYGIKYFRDFCKVSSKELIGRACKVLIIKKSFDYTDNNGEDKSGICNEIKYLNLIDNDGNLMIMNEKTEAQKDLW